MNMLRKYFFILLAAMVIASCSDDNDPKKDETELPDGDIDSQDDVDLVVTSLKGNITGDIVLAADQDWILTGPLVVEAGAKLTIEAGTTIKAQAGGTNVYIAVERDAEIQAVGTAALPITITSAAAAPEPGDWGGVLIMGNATITGGLTAVTEVVDFIYGNSPADNADDSGDIAYLILEYTGARINGEKEFNGLTLYGVGSGTNINNVAIFYGDDDAIEWFGGTVNVTNILAVNATDDLFDYTQGWSGTATNCYGIREAGYDAISTDPRGIEGDGNLDGNTPGLTPQSDAKFTNVTIVNNSTLANSGNSAMVDVVKVRRNSKGTFTNVLFIAGAGVPAPGDLVDFTDGAGTATTDANAATTISVTATGNNAATVATDNKPGFNAATITVPASANTGVANPSTVFGWTGYTF